MMVSDPKAKCTHGVTFDEEAVKDGNMSASAVRKIWPRLEGVCPLGCGYDGIAYASFKHYLWGDW